MESIWTPVLLTAAVFCSTGVNIWLFTRSQARRIEKAALGAVARAEDAKSMVETIALRVNSWKVELDNAQEAVLEGLERAESKRNRAETANRASEKRRAQMVNQDQLETASAPLSRDELLAPYRARLLNS